MHAAVVAPTCHGVKHDDERYRQHSCASVVLIPFLHACSRVAPSLRTSSYRLRPPPHGVTNGGQVCSTTEPFQPGYTGITHKMRRVCSRSQAAGGSSTSSREHPKPNKSNQNSNKQKNSHVGAVTHKTNTSKPTSSTMPTQ